MCLPVCLPADQVYGDQDMHEVVRKHCMDYLVSLSLMFMWRRWEEEVMEVMEEEVGGDGGRRRWRWEEEE